MPITAQDLLRLADQPEGEPAQPAEPVMRAGVPTELTAPKPTAAQTMADAWAEATPGPQAVKGFVRGAVERVAEPVGRLAGAAGYASATGELPPESSALSLAGDALSAGYAIHPDTRLMAMGGAAVEGIGEQLGLSQNSARMLSIAAEAGMGMRSFIRAGKVPAAEGEKLLAGAKGLRAEVDPVVGLTQLTYPERIGGELAGEARRTLLARKQGISKTIEGLENNIVRTMPRIDPQSPGYVRLGDSLAEIGNRQIKFPADIKESFGKIGNDLMMGNPVDTGEVMRLRTRLRQLTTFKDSADPDLALAGKNAGAVRRTITDALEASIPDQGLAGQWVEARTAYNTQYATPWRNLRSVIKRDVTPQQAFNRVFNPNDMHTFRALADTLPQSPAMRGKLQMGFLESLSDATEGFQQAEQAHNAFKTMRPSLAASGLFNHKELETLDLFLRRRELPNLLEKVHQVLDSPLTLKKGGVGTALGFYALHNPVLAFSAMVGSGSLPMMRRLMVLPANSPAARRLAMVAVAKTEQFARALSQNEDTTPDDTLGIDGE